MFIIRLAAEALSIADSQPVAMNIKKYPSSKSSNFLYSILSGQEDTSAIQKRSELCYSNSSSVSDIMDRMLYDNKTYSQKQRSNSVVVHRSKLKAVSNVGRRPSSVPEPNRFTPYPLHKRLHQDASMNSRSNADGYSMGSPARSVSTDSGLDEPLDLTKQMLGHGCPDDHSDQDSLTNSPISCGGLTLSIPHFKSSESYSTKYVQLSKKMARPVQSRINEWIRQMVNLVIPHSSPCSSSIGQLSAERRLNLLQASWHRVLVLYMAENTLRFVTSPLHTTEESDDGSPPAKRMLRPTQKFVDQLTALIDACSNLPFDQATYDLIRIAVILIGNQRSLDVNSLKLLEQHLAPTVDIKQFRIIISQITSLDKAQLEALFCSHLDLPVEEKLKTYFEQLSISV